jgi:cell wall-associated NlpC family hydrolase
MQRAGILSGNSIVKGQTPTSIKGSGAAELRSKCSTVFNCNGDISQLRPGDYCLTTIGGTHKGKRWAHVAVYAGNGMFWDAGRGGTVGPNRHKTKNGGKFTRAQLCRTTNKNRVRMVFRLK